VAVRLPADLPPSIPILPDAELVGVYGDTILHWRDDRPPEQIISIYGELLTKNQWRISEGLANSLTAELDTLALFLSVAQTGQQTDIFLTYIPSKSGGFRIIVPPLEILDPYSQDLLKLPELGIDSSLDLTAPVTRREYCRWLVRTNNLLLNDRPSRQLKLLNGNASPFADLPPSDTDFAAINGLVNGGILARSAQFRPDDPLTRQEMIHLKLPFDLGQAPPPATRAQLQSLWAFQDSDQISDFAVRAIVADGQLGEKSNIRRSFGLTTILQPQQPVTRAEALASLWHFGTPIDGITVADYNQKPKPKPKQ
jgi:hypothetical protein